MIGIVIICLIFGFIGGFVSSKIMDKINTVGDLKLTYYISDPDLDPNTPYMSLDIRDHDCYKKILSGKNARFNIVNQRV